MIVFGSRIYGKKDVLHYHGTCEQCGVYGPQRSYSGRRWGHLYWIPLIPETGPLRVLHECKACKNALAMEANEAEVYAVRMREAADRGLAALLAGQETLTLEDKTLDAVNEVAGSLDLLLAMGESKYVKLLVAALRQQPSCAFACSICEGIWAEWDGDVDSAETHFRNALRISTRSTLPAISLARIYRSREQYDQAEAVLEQILAASGDGTLNGLLALVRTGKGDHEGAAKAYEAFFEAMPGAASDPGLRKDYRKACKKAGRPMIL